MRVVAAAADKPFLDLETGNARLGQEAKEPPDLGHDFRADAVAGQKEEFSGCHE